MSLLNKFYRDLQAWIDEGCKSFHSTFNPKYAMCYQAIQYGGQELKEELQDDFIKAGLDPALPFNRWITGLCIEETTGTVWLNKQRLKWVKDHAIPE